MELKPGEHIETIDRFYQERILRIGLLKFSELVARNSSLSRAICLRRADEIISELLESYLSSSEAWWWKTEGDTTFYLNRVRAIQECPLNLRIRFEQEWNKAVNRLTREFIDRFVTVDGSIDWDKFVRFSNAKQDV